MAQYFCDVFRRCVAVFVAGAALWTCPSEEVSQEIGGCLAGNARFSAPTSLVSGLWFSSGLAVSWGKLQNLFEGFQAGCHVVLRGRRGTL